MYLAGEEDWRKARVEYVANDEDDGWEAEGIMTGQRRLPVSFWEEEEQDV